MHIVGQEKIIPYLGVQVKIFNIRVITLLTQLHLGEQIVGAGDSAGANLLLTTTLKCLQMEIPTPKGLFLAYAPTAVQFTPSPARLLCVMDPLLTFGFLMRCLNGN